MLVLVKCACGSMFTLKKLKFCGAGDQGNSPKCPDCGAVFELFSNRTLSEMTENLTGPAGEPRAEVRFIPDSAKITVTFEA